MCVFKQMVIEILKSYDKYVCMILSNISIPSLNLHLVLTDPRVNDWPLMFSPIPTVAMVAFYLYVVIFLGPRVMANRKPFKLNNVLIVYNAAQVVFSLTMLWEVSNYSVYLPHRTLVFASRWSTYCCFWGTRRLWIDPLKKSEQLLVFVKSP